MNQFELFKKEFRSLILAVRTSEMLWCVNAKISKTAENEEKKALRKLFQHCSGMLLTEEELLAIIRE